MLYTLVKMDIEILEEKENPFFNRRELKLIIKHPKLSTPSKTEVIKNIAEANAVDNSQVVVDYIFSKKGTSESLVKVKILKEKPKEEIKEKKGESVEAQAS